MRVATSIAVLVALSAQSVLAGQFRASTESASSSEPAPSSAPPASSSAPVPSSTPPASSSVAPLRSANPGSHAQPAYVQQSYGDYNSQPASSQIVSATTYETLAPSTAYVTVTSTPSPSTSTVVVSPSSTSDYNTAPASDYDTAPASDYDTAPASDYDVAPASDYGDSDDDYDDYDNNYGVNTVMQMAGAVTANGGAPVATIGSCPDITITVTNQVFATLVTTITPSLLAVPASTPFRY
ncbi:hypothetical protein IWW39_005588 [Coemansia spiralis]|uniref:Uncharacterized protein n=1 Tax=Coemansia spiralis TaxID=417178 RepID=A0A9W8GHA2_9FUNG|nr:hypothetical protein IWW39_005588 [Coemansia spiralis]